MDTNELTALAAANIRTLLDLKEMTQRQLAADAGMKEPDVSRLLRAARDDGGDVKTSLATLVRVAGALDVPVVELLSEGFWLLLRGTVAAGPRDRPEVYTPPRTIFLPGKFPRGCFALKVNGRSCTQFGICDGDVVVIKPVTEPQENRFVVTACAEGHTLKAFFEGELLQFRPEDTEPVVVEVTEHTHTVGIVIGGEYGPRVYKAVKPRRK